MPIDWIGDWKIRPEGTREDKIWTGVLRPLAEHLIKVEPRVRFRVRNFPPRATSGDDTDKVTGKKITVVSSPIALADTDVPESLRNRLEVPKAREFWVKNYKCLDCTDPRTGKPGIWVPHVRRKLHKGHKVKPGKPLMKGLDPDWRPTHRLITGTSERLRSHSGLMYSIALTSAPVSVAHLKGFDSILILPLKSGVDHEQEKAKLLADPGMAAEYIEILPANKNDAVKALLEFICSVDPEFVSSGVKSDGGLNEDDKETHDQITRDNAARAFLNHTRRKGQAKQASALAPRGGGTKQKQLPPVSNKKESK